MHQILHRLLQRHFGPNHPALENYSWGYSASSGQVCAGIKTCSLSFGNCSPAALTATGHSEVAGLTALGWRWCLWKWTIRWERYKGWHPPFWEIADLCESGVGSLPVVSCVVAHPFLACHLPLWKVKSWRAAVHYSQEGGGMAWRNEIGAGVKEEQRWTVRNPLQSKRAQCSCLPWHADALYCRLANIP